MTDPPAPNTGLSLTPTTLQREQTIEALSRSFADDTLTMDEFERRAELVYRALTVIDLRELVSDLPSQPAPPDSAHPNASTRTGKSIGAKAAGMVHNIRTIFGSTERKGAMRVPSLLNIRTLFGNTELDLRHASFSSGVTEIDVRATFGNVEIWVPEGVRVEIDCSAILASVESQVPEPRTGALTDIVIRVTGRAVFANLELKMTPGVELRDSYSS